MIINKKIKKVFHNKKIFLTGGTGSFGNKFTEMTIKYLKPKKLIIFSRDEMKQWEMMQKYSSNNQIEFVIGDIRDKASLSQAINGVDYVIHAAATKIVPLSETNPTECVKTNIMGAINLIEVCKEKNIKKVVALSTDKASNPINLYGATKLASDKLIIAANINIARQSNTRFSVVRYGNVMGSRGSVIPFFLEQSKKNIFTITDKKMTRFMISLEQGVELVWKAFEDMIGGEIYVKKIPSINVTDIPKAICKNPKIKIIGIRPGEKIHESMISIEDSFNTYEYNDYFKILPSFANKIMCKSMKKNGKKVNEGFSYSSNNNNDWMEFDELKKFILKIKKEQSVKSN